MPIQRNTHYKQSMIAPKAPVISDEMYLVRLIVGYLRSKIVVHEFMFREEIVGEVVIGLFIHRPDGTDRMIESKQYVNACYLQNGSVVIVSGTGDSI